MIPSLRSQTNPQRRSRSIIAALVALALSAAGVLVYSAVAHATNVSVNYVSDINGNTTSVSATVIESNFASISSGYYVCNSAVTINQTLSITAGSTTNVIIGNNCQLNITGGTMGIALPATSTLNFFREKGDNYGWANILGSNGPGIGAINAGSGILNFYGGNFQVRGATTTVNRASPGIGVSGSSATPAPGAVSVVWDASLWVRGSITGPQTPPAAGIGTGTNGVGNASSPPRGNVYINTTGIVQALEAFSTTVNSGYRAPGIGRGSITDVNYPAQITTYAVSKSIVGPGNVWMRDPLGSFPDTTTFNEVVVGSAVTFYAAASANAEISSVSSNLAALPGNTKTVGYFRLPVTGSAGTVGSVIFVKSTSTTVTASPAGQQTRPGNVTVTGAVRDLYLGANVPNGTGVTQLYVNGTLTSTGNVTNGITTFTLAAPPVGTYQYQIRYLGVNNTLGQSFGSADNYRVVAGTQAPLTINGLNGSYLYGDGPLSISVTGGSSTGAFGLSSSNPTVATLGSVVAGSASLTLNQAGSFSVSGTRAADTNYEAATIESSLIIVAEATPIATLTRTGGEHLQDPISLTMQLAARGSGSTPVGYVQFFMKGTKLGDPLPLVDLGGGLAAVTLNGIPLQKLGSQQVTAEFLGEPGKYTSVSKSEDWYLGSAYCKVATPED